MAADLLEVALDRPLPQNTDAERAVLGSVLINNDAMFRVNGIVDVGDFFRDAHRTVFAAMKVLAAQEIEIDLTTLKHELERTRTLEKVGGAAYISSLVDGIPDVGNVERYARIVARQSRLRNLIIVGNSMMRAAMEAEDEPEIIAAETMTKLTNASTRSESQSRRFVEVIGDAYEEAERRRVENRQVALETGDLELDSYQVLRPTFVAVACPSKHGKTAYIVHLMRRLAQHGHRNLFFTLESAEEEIAWRHASSVSGLPHSRIRDWRTQDQGNFRALADSDYRELAKVQAEAAKLPIYLNRRLRAIEDICAEIRRLHTLEGISAVMIDYVQLVRFPGGPKDREERIAYIAQRFLETAIDLKMLVVAASQVNKDWVERADGRLHPSDMKYAAAISESARAALMFTRPHVQKPEIRACQVNFQVAANNEGRTGEYEMHFNETTQRFGEGDCANNDCRLAPIELPKMPLFEEDRRKNA